MDSFVMNESWLNLEPLPALWNFSNNANMFYKEIYFLF